MRALPLFPRPSLCQALKLNNLLIGAVASEQVLFPELVLHLIGAGGGQNFTVCVQHDQWVAQQKGGFVRQTPQPLLLRTDKAVHHVVGGLQVFGVVPQPLGTGLKQNFRILDHLSQKHRVFFQKILGQCFVAGNQQKNPPLQPLTPAPDLADASHIQHVRFDPLPLCQLAYADKMTAFRRHVQQAQPIIPQLLDQISDICHGNPPVCFALYPCVLPLILS